MSAIALTAIVVALVQLSATRPHSADPPAGEYICQREVGGKSVTTGWLTVRVDGTYTDHLTTGTGSWRYDYRLLEFHFTADSTGKRKETRAVYRPATDSIVFPGAGGGQRCYRSR